MMTTLTRRNLGTSRGRLSFDFAPGSPSDAGESRSLPPLLFLHGVPGSSSVWTPVIERFFERGNGGRSLVVPDLLGFGRSDAPAAADDVGVGAQAEAVIDLVDSLGLAAATFVTHDFGGPVALEVFRRRPQLVSGLILSATNAFPDAPIPFPLSTIFWPWIGPVASRLLFSPPSLRLLLRVGAGSGGERPDPAAHIGDPVQARTIAMLFEHSLRNLAAIYGPLEDVLAQIDTPTAVIWGTRDPFFALDHGRRTAAAIAGATFTALEGAGHFLPSERPDAYVDAIDALSCATASTIDRTPTQA